MTIDRKFVSSTLMSLEIYSNHSKFRGCNLSKYFIIIIIYIQDRLHKNKR
jgi:hypothetical protein